MRFLVAMFIAVLSLATCWTSPAGQTSAEVRTVMTERGPLLFRDDFKQPLGKDWPAGKGKWEIVDGAVRVTQIPADMHAAVRRHPISFDNIIIQYEFRFEGGKQTTLSINGANGHVCRVLLRPTGFSVQKDKDKKTDAKAVVLDTVDTPIKAGEWHTILVEIQGKELLACLDGKQFAFGAHDGINVKKNSLGLTVAGASVSFKNLRAWEATPSKSWDATRGKLLAARKAKAAAP